MDREGPVIWPSQGMASSGRWRFLLLMIIFNALLISMAFLSLQQKEMETRVLTLRQRRILVEERLSTEEITRTRVVTIVVTPLPSAGP